MKSPVARSSSLFFPGLQTCDALVVGGGPAGLAAGIALGLRGLDVVVADALIPPIDKACGEGLMPESVRELAALGVELRSGRPFRGVHFANRNGRCEDLATAEFTSGQGIGIRRKDLHRSLIDRAEEIGVRLKWGSRVDLGGPQVTVGGEAFRYRYLIGADGEGSRIRRWAGLDGGSLRSERLSFRRHYRIAPWSHYVEVHWCDAGQAYVTPVAEDEVCVAAMTRRRGLNLDNILDDLPYLADKLRAGPAAGRDRGAGTTTRKLIRVTRGNVALIGDASGSADATTGQGLASAFREALLLADALSRDTIAAYEAGHAEILRVPQAMAAGLLMMDRWPALRDRAMRTFASRPNLFAKLLAVHSGEERIGRFAVTHGVQFGFQLLTRVRRDDCLPPASHLPLEMRMADERPIASGEAPLEPCRECA